jgi:hypothetical protein
VRRDSVSRSIRMSFRHTGVGREGGRSLKGAQ